MHYRNFGMLFSSSVLWFKIRHIHVSRAASVGFGWQSVNWGFVSWQLHCNVVTCHELVTPSLSRSLPASWEVIGSAKLCGADSKHLCCCTVLQDQLWLPLSVVRRACGYWTSIISHKNPRSAKNNTLLCLLFCSVISCVKMIDNDLCFSMWQHIYSIHEKLCNDYKLYRSEL